MKELSAFRQQLLQDIDKGHVWGASMESFGDFETGHIVPSGAMRWLLESELATAELVEREEGWVYQLSLTAKGEALLHSSDGQAQS